MAQWNGDISVSYLSYAARLSLKSYLAYEYMCHKAVTGGRMSCNGLNLLCGIEGSGGNGRCYIGRETPISYETSGGLYLTAERDTYEPAIEITRPLYASSKHSDVEFWKPLLFYGPVQRDTPSAKEFGFSYHPTLDLALTYLGIPQKSLSPLKTSPIKSLPIFEKERQQLEELIAQEKRRMVQRAA